MRGNGAGHQALRIHCARQKRQIAAFRQALEADRFAVASNILELLSIFFFARQRSNQLFTTDIIQNSQIVLRELPQHVWSDAVVFMPQDVADA
jgi:hypothetical protein